MQRRKEEKRFCAYLHLPFFIRLCYNSGMAERSQITYEGPRRVGRELLVKNTLDDKILLRLGQIFEAKKWEIEDEISGDISLFDRFCIRLMELENDADREFMLDLTEKYLVISMDGYEKYLVKVFEKFITTDKEELEKLETIHVFPVQNGDHPGKTKSGNLMCYLIQGIVLRRFGEFHDKRIRIIETFEGIRQHKEEIEMLLLIDDYLGSGDTALGCINLLEELGLEKEKMKVISLVVQCTGKRAVEEYGVRVYSCVDRNKGITDNYDKEEAEAKIEQMIRISRRIKVRKDLYLGYKDSEGLVSMLKTPNNTFPFYWFEAVKNEKNTYAPFPRRGNVGVEE